MVEQVLESFRDTATYQRVGKFTARSASSTTASQSVVAPYSATAQVAYIQDMADKVSLLVMGGTKPALRYPSLLRLSCF